jgi:hypothetical protein
VARGNIYGWDYKHGRVEKYDKQSRHLGDSIIGRVSGSTGRGGEEGKRIAR